MIRGPFDPTLEELPAVIPVFPLTGALLLPGGHLPLNVFEPRYLAMTRAALAEPQRLIGMVQPREPDPSDNRGLTAAALKGEVPALYEVGCAGRIATFGESDDGRYMVTLAGVCRFAIAEELAPTDGYRRVRAGWRRFAGDLAEADGADIARDRLLAALKAYLAERDIQADWRAVQAAEDERLVTTLAMSCPFAPSERQALLEAPTLPDRARIMVALLEMAAVESGPASEAKN